MIEPLMTSNSIPSPANLGLLFALSFFLGLAFEDYFARSNSTRPGGIRTFPLLALAAGALYSLDTATLLPFTAGLLIVGAWLGIFYWDHQREKDERGEPNVGIVVLVLNLYVYVLGAVTLGLPNWVAVGMTVSAVLLLTGREQLHQLARSIEMKEINTAGQFLILTGIILPLLPDAPMTTLTTITPRQVWLALVLVSSLSYASYLAQRYWPSAAHGLWMAALGGLYSSTAMTVVLSRQARRDSMMQRRASAGITLATGVMYLRILAIVAAFNLSLAGSLAAPLIGLASLAFIMCAAQYFLPRRTEEPKSLEASGGNPLELSAAMVFAVLFIAISILASWVQANFGMRGIYTMAAVVGVTDIDPFVLSLAQGNSSVVNPAAIAPAILIATASNNVLKAAYTIAFAGRKVAIGAASLLLLACSTAVFSLFVDLH